MAKSPELKIYTPDGEYVASCKYVTDAAAIVALWGENSTVRLGHSKRHIIWAEGSENIRAGESYDAAGDIMLERIHAIQKGV